MVDEVSVKTTLPYGAYKGAKSFLSKLKESGVPPRIDNSVMRGMSGSSRSEVRAAFKFLGLIDESDKVLPPMHALVAALDTAAWGEALNDQLFSAYRGVIGNDGDWLDNGTAQQLRDRFKAAGSEGSMLDRSIRFFLAAMGDAGQKLSPYFNGATSSRTAGGRASSTKSPKGAKKTVPKKEPEGEDKGAQQPPVVPYKQDPNSVSYPFTFPGKGAVNITLPATMTVAEWAIVNTYIAGVLGLTNKTK